MRNLIQSETWENSDWEQIDNDDNLQGLIRLKSLKNDQVYDIRLIGLGKNREIKLLTQNGVKVGGLYNFYEMCINGIRKKMNLRFTSEFSRMIILFQS